MALLAALVVLLVCTFPAYLAYEHPAIREPLGIAVGVLGALGAVYSALRPVKQHGGRVSRGPEVAD
ncbi:hypothetical protein KQY30_31215 [Streptomyces sp. GMY02]|uniref:hypothetical protein n=1 Tax=Streptomyces sp. GMY02 TaxID=1333528 RepID=UPI001C2C3E62|nr:hypothetical protein [Streptomyces sp. GMY02]QXE38040.1 hypothetical protein KQY30_31215 [Streptomyces sp. GMY02]